MPSLALANRQLAPTLQEQHDAVSSCEISRPSPATIGPKDLLPVKVAAPRQGEEEGCSCNSLHAAYTPGQLKAETVSPLVMAAAQGRSDVKKQPAWVQAADADDGRGTPE